MTCQLDHHAAGVGVVADGRDGGAGPTLMLVDHADQLRK